MDIHSISNEIFELYPLFIPGWITPIKPADRAHGGIPKSIYDGNPLGLQVVIDPWTERQFFQDPKAEFDSVALYLNDDEPPVTSHTVQPGDEHKRIPLYVPHNLLKHGTNRLYYVVTRLGGHPQPSRDLDVLYHLQGPIDLVLEIPGDVVTDGISAERAAQGVKFTFKYTGPELYDLVRLQIGNQSFDLEVTHPGAELSMTLYTADFEKTGDGKLTVYFRVTDQLGNFEISDSTALDIHLAVPFEPPAPTVRGQTGNNFSPTQPEIRVLVPEETLQQDDLLSVNWQGATADAAGSYTSPQRPVSDGLEIAVPRSVLAYSLGKTVTVRYIIVRKGVTSPSRPLTLNILTLPASALISPTIIEADANNVLDVIALGTNNATVHALLWTLIDAGQQVWMSLEGKKADGSAHDLPIWSGGEDKVNTAWVNQGFWPYTLANNYLKQLGDSTTLTIRFKASLDKSNNATTATVFPDRVYTIKAVELGAPTITSVQDESKWEIPDNGHTVHTRITLTGSAPAGQKVEVFLGTISKGIAEAGPDRIWTRAVSGLALNVLHTLKAVGQYANNPTSHLWRLTVLNGVRPAITAAHDSKGQPISNGGNTVDRTVRFTGTATKYLEVEIYDGATSTGKKARANDKGEWTVELTGLTHTKHVFKAKALYGSGTESEEWTLTVTASTTVRFCVTTTTQPPGSFETIPNGSTLNIASFRNHYLSCQFYAVSPRRHHSLIIERNNIEWYSLASATRLNEWYRLHNDFYPAPIPPRLLEPGRYTMYIYATDSAPSNPRQELLGEQTVTFI
ncbi:hypothetical protein [Pseudomonas sp. GM30]|uniref:hypothetical protein n=1 Tax=Pseudomonas sp. GM30 TaxID=1144328 RepID=UPI0003E7FC22|nr:hypothetical protein [Pseudomonas sp. GM30]EUB82819.1 hypothetical protein PMI25_003263 [Pseudomonas sp. GM30]